MRKALGCKLRVFDVQVVIEKRIQYKRIRAADPQAACELATRKALRGAKGHVAEQRVTHGHAREKTAP